MWLPYIYRRVRTSCIFVSFFFSFFLPSLFFPVKTNPHCVCRFDVETSRDILPSPAKTRRSAYRVPLPNDLWIHLGALSAFQHFLASLLPSLLTSSSHRKKLSPRSYLALARKNLWDVDRSLTRSECKVYSGVNVISVSRNCKFARIQYRLVGERGSMDIER